MSIFRLLYKPILSMFIILSLLGLAACSSPQKPDLGESKDKTEEKKPPEELDKLKDSINKVETALKAIHEESKKPMFIQQEAIEKEHSKNETQNKEGQENPSGSQENKNSNNQEQQNNETPKLTPEELKLKLEQEIYKKFEEIKKDVMELHSAWNSYEAKAIADFAMQTTINDFESALNNLTKTLESQDSYLSLLEVNQLYKHLPDFYMLYESNVPPDLDRLRFAAKKIQLLSEKKDFTGANDVLLYFENIWMTARPKLKKGNEETVSKFEFAFADLKNSVMAKNEMIIEAKAEVLLKLVDEMEKKAEKSASSN